MEEIWHVIERQDLLLRDAQLPREIRQLRAKLVTPAPDRGGTAYLREGLGGQKRSNGSDRPIRPAVVIGRILTCEIAQSLFVLVRFARQDQEITVPIFLPSESLNPQGQPTFESHVEPRQWALRSPIHTTDVMDGPPRLSNDPDNLVQSKLGCPLVFQGCSGNEATVVDREKDHVQERLVCGIERTVYKYTAVVRTRGGSHGF